MSPRWEYSLSPSKLNLLNANGCERCFYLHNKLKLERPRGIFPSLPNGIDRVLKEYVDRYRQGLPPCLEDKLPKGIRRMSWR